MEGTPGRVVESLEVSGGKAARQVAGGWVAGWGAMVAVEEAVKQVVRVGMARVVRAVVRVATASGMGGWMALVGGAVIILRRKSERRGPDGAVGALVVDCLDSAAAAVAVEMAEAAVALARAVDGEEGWGPLQDPIWDRTNTYRLCSVLPPIARWRSPPSRSVPPRGSGTRTTHHAESPRA